MAGDAVLMRALVLVLLLVLPLTGQAQGAGMAITGSLFQYTVQSGDSLTGIGARFGMDPLQLAKANGLKYNALLKFDAVSLPVVEPDRFNARKAR